MNDSPNGETEQHAVVAEDIEAQDGEAAEVDRMRELRNNLHKVEQDEVDEG